MGNRLVVPKITAFVGPNGSGKTLCAVELLVRSAIDRGLPVLSNMTVRYDGWVPLVSWNQLLEFYGGIVVFDEISAVFPAREFRSLPAQLVRVTRQLRKRRIRLAWTDPSWEGADVTLRRVTQGVFVCRGFLGDEWVREEGRHRFPRSGKRVERIDPDQWANNRLFRWNLYDARALDEFTLGRAQKDGKVTGRWYWRPSGVAHTLYETEEEVGMLDHLDDSGVCPSCHGTRRRPRCTCKAVDRKPLADYVPAEEEDFDAA